MSKSHQYYLSCYSHIRWLDSLVSFGSICLVIRTLIDLFVSFTDGSAVCAGYTLNSFICLFTWYFTALTAFYPPTTDSNVLTTTPVSISSLPSLPISLAPKFHPYRSVLCCSLHLCWVVRMLPVLLYVHWFPCTCLCLAWAEEGTASNMLAISWMRRKDVFLRLMSWLYVR